MKRLFSIILVLALLSGASLGCAQRAETAGGELAETLRGVFDSHTQQQTPGEDAGKEPLSIPELFRQRLPQSGEQTEDKPELTLEGIKRFLPFDWQEQESITPIVSGDFFADTWHDDVEFADMQDLDYSIRDFMPFAEAIERIAQNGGSAEEFTQADNAAWWELYYVYTLGCVAEINYSQNPGDADAATRSAVLSAVYSEALDSFCLAMQQLALSENARLLEEAYSPWQIEYFEQYVPMTEEDVDLSNRETELVQEYYTLISAERPDYDAIVELFVELVGLRNETAALYGYDSYAEYAYDSFYYRSYSPQDAAGLWDVAKESFSPLMEEHGYAVSLRSDELYYSDEVDVSPERILDSMGYCLPRMSAELGEAFDYMIEYGLYDIEYSQEKMNTGYLTDLVYYNEPFIFNCPYGSYYDYTDMFHEFGHFVNAFYTETDLLFGADDNDLAELQSQGMEVMAMHFYTDIFGADCGGIIRQDVLMNLVYSVLDGAMYDEFQQRVYAETDLTAQEVIGIYKQVYSSYGYEPYEGYEYAWMDIAHNFDYPFYYISYAVSAIPALELFTLSQEDYAAALETYLTVAALDLELWYFTDALAQVGLGDVFDAAVSRRIAAGLEPALR